MIRDWRHFIKRFKHPVLIRINPAIILPVHTQNILIGRSLLCPFYYIIERPFTLPFYYNVYIGILQYLLGIKRRMPPAPYYLYVLVRLFYNSARLKPIIYLIA